MVSIIIPVHNGARYLSFAIDSVLHQTYQDWELIIVDDSSTDETPLIIEEYLRRDSRIRRFKTARQSGSPAQPRNIGIDNAKGEYIAFLDADDLWLEHKLEEQIPLFDTDENIDVVFSYYEKIDEDGYRDNRIIISPHTTCYKEMLKGNVIGCLTAVYRYEKYRNIRFKRIGHEDYLFWLMILKHGGFAINSRSNTALYRIDRASISRNKFKTMKWQWNIYRNELNFGILKSIYYFIFYAYNAMNKAVK